MIGIDQGVPPSGSGSRPSDGAASTGVSTAAAASIPNAGDLPCACGRIAKLRTDHADIIRLKRDLRRSGASGTAEALAYIEELEALWDYAKRQGNVWRGIASAMGYEPRAHGQVRPTRSWLLDRVDMFRARAASVDERPQGQDPEEGLGAEPASAVPAQQGDAQALSTPPQPESNT